MAAQPAIYNSPNSDYTPECEEQGDGTQRQVVKVADATTAASPASASVTITTGEVVASNTSRRGLVIVNDGAAIVYLAFGVAAEANKGIRLNSNGGSFSMTPMMFCTSAVNAITASGTSSVSIQEWT